MGKEKLEGEKGAASSGGGLHQFGGVHDHLSGHSFILLGWPWCCSLEIHFVRRIVGISRVRRNNMGVIRKSTDGELTAVNRRIR